MNAVLKTVPEPSDRRSGDNLPATVDVQDVMRLLQNDLQPDRALSPAVQFAMEGDRRRLRRAVQLLTVAHRKLHEQFLENEEQQQRLLIAIRDEWAARRRRLEEQLAAAALRKARLELADERTRMEYDLSVHRQQLVSEHQQLVERRELSDRERRSWEQRSEAVEKEVQQTQQKLLQSELTILQDRTEWSEERRRWNDERREAECIIRELLEELHSLTQDEKPSEETMPEKRAA